MMLFVLIHCGSNGIVDGTKSKPFFAFVHVDAFVRFICKAIRSPEL